MIFEESKHKVTNQFYKSTWLAKVKATVKKPSEDETKRFMQIFL